jgi:hypothetical protein
MPWDELEPRQFPTMDKLDGISKQTMADHYKQGTRGSEQIAAVSRPASSRTKVASVSLGSPPVIEYRA